MKKGFLLVSLLAGSILVTGCLNQLKSRKDLKGDTQISQPPQEEVYVSENTESTPSAPVFKQEERNEQMRVLRGRVEEAENQVNELRESMIQLAESRQQEKEQAAGKLQAYEEAIRKLEQEILALKNNKHEAARAPKKSVKKSGANSSAQLREDYHRGEDHFRQKKWKDAIVSYQKYREDFPKGKLYPDATYKIGLCFLELGLKDESKSFFEEVKVKYPKSPLAKKADKQLKSL